MNFNKITSFLIAVTFIASNTLPVYASETADADSLAQNEQLDLAEEIISSDSEEKNYSIEVQNAIYFEDGFDNSNSFSSENNSAQIVLDETERGRILYVPDGDELTYSFAGNTVKWDGESVSESFVGKGTEQEPYLIRNGADLKLLQVNVRGGKTYEGEYFTLTNNIDLQNYEWDSIGNNGFPFKGNFNGNFNKVINIKRTSFTDATDRYFGFFGCVQGTVRNLGVENVVFEFNASVGSQFTGGLVGYLKGEVDNCYARNVSVTNLSTTQSIPEVAGLIGDVREGSSVLNSYVVDFGYTAQVSISTDKIAPLCGYLKSNNGKIKVNNCYVAGKYILNGDFANYFVMAAEEKHSNISSANNYVAHGVGEYKTTLTQRDVNLLTVSEAKMKLIAADLGEAFATDETGLMNKGFPYHKQCLDIPDEAIIGFDIDFSGSEDVSLKIFNTNEEVCVEETIENTFSDGWHSVQVDLKSDSYEIYVDGVLIKTESVLSSTGHSSMVITQNDEKAYKLDNISIKKDYTQELSEKADEIFEFISKENDLNNISEMLKVPGDELVQVEWLSSDERIIDDDLTVIEHSLRLPVTLTAKYDGNSSAGIQKPAATVKFDVFVAGKENAPAEDKLRDLITYYLKDSMLTDESLDFITKDLKALPSEYEGISINWQSSDENFITNDGKVTLPQVDEDNAEITFSAIVTLNGVSMSTDFDLVVPAPLSDRAKLKLAMDDIGYDRLTTEEINKITKNITLPKKGLYDSVISWSSSDPSVISDDGTVTRPTKDTFVNMTATFEINGVTDTKVFSFNVLVAEEAAAAQDAEAISGIPETITENFTLPLSGVKYGSTITWSSDDSSIEINENKAFVTRPQFEDGDRTVLLQATVTNGSQKATADFYVTVMKLPPSGELINTVYNSITWESISVDEMTEVKNNLSLRTDYENDVSATWSSEPAGYIDDLTGVITRPKMGEDDVDVTLTLTVGEGIAPKTKTFDVTIKAFSSTEEVLEKATDELSFNVLSSDPIDSVFNNLYLPTEWRYGTSIEWSSDNEELIAVSGEEGIVTTPQFGTENKAVTLSAKILSEGKERTKTFYITLAESDGIKEVFNLDYEPYEIGELKSVNNIVVYKQYVGASIAEDPVNPENKVMKLNKDKTFAASAQKGTRLSTVGETRGNFELTTRLYFEKLPDRSFYICGAFNTGEEITISIKKSGDGVTIAGKLFPFSEWIDFKLTFDTYEKKYKIYVNDVFLKEYNFKYVDSKPTECTFSRFYFDFVYQTAAGEHIVYLDNTRFIKNVYCRDALNEASTRFETEFLTRQDIQNITEDLVIPQISITELTIETISSNPDVVTDEGKVTRPLDEDAAVDFTVRYINKYGSTREKVFNLIVKGGVREPIADSTKVLEDIKEVMDSINDNHTLNYITSDLKLPKTVTYGSTITYISSDTSVISDEGKVRRPSGADKEVNLTVKVENGEASEIRTIKLVVKKASQSTSGGSSGGSSRGGSSGGVALVPKGEINTAPTVKPTEPTQSKDVFTDISTHWAKEYIEKAYKEGIVNGNDDGTFSPDSTVTREAFITMLVRAVDLKSESGESVFNDVNESDWFAQYVNTAYKNSIVSGISEELFGVGQNVSRQDMCVMVYNALKDKFNTEITDEKFTDDEKIADYAKTAVYALKQSGIVNGRGEGGFEPYGTATRAEAAKIISVIVDSIIK